MDKLQLCAKAFQKLLEYEYHFIIGRKGKLREFYLNFDKADFHHLSGLHKLKDIAQIQQGKRNKIFDQIISGEITQVLIEKSVYYEQMQGRIFPLTDLEKMLDDNQMIFRYNEKVHKFSLIKADYLLEGQSQYTLLKKEKKHLPSGEITIQYDRLTPKSHLNDHCVTPK